MASLSSSRRRLNPRVIVVDDPGVSITIRRDGAAVSVQSIANSPAQMAQLQAAYNEVASTYSQGRQDPFIQQFQQGTSPSDHASAQPELAPASGTGSSTPPNELNVSPQLLQENSNVQLANAGQGNSFPIVVVSAVGAGTVTTNSQLASPIPDQPAGLQINTTAPTVTATAATPGTGVEGVGATISITLTISEAVTVSGLPQLQLNDGGIATYDAAHSTATSLVFDYTVAAGQNTANLAVTNYSYPNGATVTDAAGNVANLSGSEVTFSGVADQHHGAAVGADCGEQRHHRHRGHPL